LMLQVLSLGNLRDRVDELIRENPPDDDTVFIGGLTRREYFTLSEEEEEQLWSKLYREAEQEIGDDGRNCCQLRSVW
jgi:hypothetical protein